MGASLRVTARVARAPRPRLLGFRRGRLAGARRTSSGRAAGSGRLLDRLAGVLHVLPEAAHRVPATGGGANQHPGTLQRRPSRNDHPFHPSPLTTPRTPPPLDPSKIEIRTVQPTNTGP